MSRNGYYQIGNIYPNLKHPEKYKGRPLISCRSSWEIKFTKWLDSHPGVIEWSSEEIVIPYILPTDGKQHRYFVDYWVKIKTTDSTEIEYLIEVKPFSQTKPPEPQKVKTKSYISRTLEYLKNEAKWKAAEHYCNQLKLTGKNIEFKIVTEKDVNF